MAKAETLMGFAARAGKVLNGYNTCLMMMDRHKAKLLIVTEDISENSRDKMISNAEKNKVPYRIYGTMDELSHITGTAGKGIFVITDRQFAETISGEIDKAKAEKISEESEHTTL